VSRDGGFSFLQRVSLSRSSVLKSAEVNLLLLLGELVVLCCAALSLWSLLVVGLKIFDFCTPSACNQQFFMR
jgi:hypothetical protein